MGVRPTLHANVERPGVGPVLGCDLATVTAGVAVHHLNDAHLVCVDLHRERERERERVRVCGRESARERKR